MTPYHQTLGMLYYCLDKAGYAHNKQIVDHWADRSFSAGIKRTERACSTYHPVLAMLEWPLTVIKRLAFGNGGYDLHTRLQERK